MIQYSFTENEHNVSVEKHGSSKENVPYRRTFPSTLNALKKESESKLPKRAVHSISEAAGGIEKAIGAGALPRNRRQASYCRSILKETNSSQVSADSEALYRVILMCKENEGGKNEFVRHVSCAPQNLISCVLYSDWQLADLKRFCASNVFGVNIMGVDPTFDSTVKIYAK